jgi:hypothetical protein
MIELSKAEIAALRDLKRLCGANADLVIVGAIAFKIYFPSIERSRGTLTSPLL